MSNMLDATIDIDIKLIEGDILISGAPYIMHQCNCVTTKAHGLSKAVADFLPQCDVYGKRRAIKNRNCAIPEDREIPGTIKVMKSEDDISSDIIGSKPEVIALFDQYLPGKPGQYKMYYPDDGYSDDAEARVHAFEKCLKQVIVYFKKEVNEANNRTIIACPCFIGCGLGGSVNRWPIYRKLLIKANKSLDKLNFEIVLYLL